MAKPAIVCPDCIEGNGGSRMQKKRAILRMYASPNDCALRHGEGHHRHYPQQSSKTSIGTSSLAKRRHTNFQPH